MSDKLKACPFCGETPEITDHFKGEEYGSRMVHRCETLGAISLDWQSRASIRRAWKTRAQPPSQGGEPFNCEHAPCKSLGEHHPFCGYVKQNSGLVEFERYDAGLLNDFGGGNVEWWQDYIRAELDRAHDFYQSQKPVSATDDPVAIVEYTGYEPANSLKWLNKGLAYMEPGTKLYTHPADQAARQTVTREDAEQFLVSYHAEVWAAAEDEDSRVAYDEAGRSLAKAFLARFDEARPADQVVDGVVVRRQALELALSNDTMAYLARAELRQLLAKSEGVK